MNIREWIKTFNVNIQEKFVDFSVTGNKKEETYNIIFTFKSMLSSEDIITFYNEGMIFFQKNLNVGFNILINYVDPINFNDFDMVSYYNDVFNDLSKSKSRLLVMKGLNVSFENNEYTIYAPDTVVNFSLYTREVEKRFSTFGIPVTIKIESFKQEVKEEKVVEVVDEDDFGVKTVKVDIPEKPKEKKSTGHYQYSGRPNTKISSQNLEPIKNIPTDPLGLSDYENTNGPLSFRVKGEVIEKEIKTPGKKEYKNGKMNIFTIVITDYTDSIKVTKFVFKEDELEELNSIKVSNWVEVSGMAEYSAFDRDVVLKANVIEKIDAPKKEERMDNYGEKRCELHLHSKMSTMDAIGEIADYFKLAAKWGHKALAITDHDGVYGFPQVMHAVKDNNLDIKPIYGVELSMVDTNKNKIAFNDKDILLEDATYTVLDVETTGLSNQFDEIIEIAAYKLHNGKHVSSFEELIKTERPLPKKIISLTNITNEMLNEKGKDRNVVLREFYNYIKDTIIVAHNAKFDSGMIYESFKRCGIEFDEFPVIDTLPLLKALHFDDLKGFGLDRMTKFYKVQLTEHHRATDDAYATMECFNYMLMEVRNKGIVNYNKLNTLINEESWKWLFGDHITMLAKNQTGYKNLFRILSDSLTTHMYKKARALKQVIQEYREGLLIGSACINGEIFETALNRSYEELLELVDFYDYIEVQPLSVYAHLKIGTYIDPDYRLQEAVKKIIKAAEEKGKIVVATGDVHYVNPEDQKYRDIYLRTKSVGGGNHPLEKYPGITMQHFRTTEEMLNEFDFLDPDLAYQIVITNTNAIADMIDDIQVFPKGLFAPADDEFKDSLNIPSIEGELQRMVNENVHKLYGDELPLIVKERLDKELNSIITNKFCSVYFMSHILVKKSLEDGYLVGSRGSVGSSFVATMMNITEVNPLSPHYRCPRCKFSSFKMNEEEKTKYGIRPIEIDLQEKLKDVDSGFDLPDAICPICGTPLKKDGHDIPFETFLGFKGDKVPDIDLNFSGEYQPKAHEFIRSVMGYDNAFRAGTLATVAEKTAYGYVLGYCEDNHINMRKAEKERVAKIIEGAKRTTGQHPGGIVVVPKRIEIYDITPIQYPSDDTTNNFRTTHFEYHTFESNLLKLDILGHDDPTIIRFFMNYVNDHPNEFPFSKAQDIPVDDKEVLKLFSGTESLGVTKEEILSEVGSIAIPEFGTGFVGQMLVDTKPKTFAELVKISGLSHGTDVWLNNAKDLVTGLKADYGQIPFSKIIGCRDDIMVDLMYMGLEPSMAFKIMEFVRKGKAAKDKESWAKHMEYMREHGIPEWYIWSCGQIKYMFPKAHATAYVLMALRVAWFKVHKPLLFYSGFFSIRVDAYEIKTMCSDANTIRNRVNDLRSGKLDEQENLSDNKVSDILDTLKVALEMVSRGYHFKMVDINESLATTFKIIPEENALLCPFIAIDGLGASVAEGIVEERNKAPFKSISDVLSRTKINLTLADTMKRYGCFGDLENEVEEETFDLFSI